MNEKPHIKIETSSCSSNNWCVNYAGFLNRLEKVSHCKAGVDYDSVAVKVDFTYSREDGFKQSSSQAHPCFKYEHPLTNGCAHCRFPTAEEIKAHDDEMNGEIRRLTTVHVAIVSDLDRRHKAGDTEVKMNPCCESEYDEDGPKNFVSGSGKMECPICKTGTRVYSRAAYNGHVHTKCTTTDCVAFMQ